MQTQYAPLPPPGIASVTVQRKGVNGWKVATVIVSVGTVLAILAGAMLYNAKAHDLSDAKAAGAAQHAALVQTRETLQGSRAENGNLSASVQTLNSNLDSVNRTLDAAESAGAACYRTAQYFAGNGWASLHDVRECVSFYRGRSVTA